MTTYRLQRLSVDVPAGPTGTVRQGSAASEVLDAFADALTGNALPVYAAVRAGRREAFPRASVALLGAGTARRLDNLFARVRHPDADQPAGAGDVATEMVKAGDEPATIGVSVLYRAVAGSPEPGPPWQLLGGLLAAASLLFAIWRAS